jgi:VWFA-related protein
MQSISSSGFKVAALATLLCVNLAAQTLDETIEVSIVNVDVLVTDKAGNRVTGLRADDFEIREDGKVQPITNFSEYVAAAASPNVSIESAPADATPRPNVAPRARRNIIIFIEPSGLPNFRAKELFDSLRALLRKAVGPGDRVAITTWSYPPRVRQGFTDDIAVLTKTLDAIEVEASNAMPSGSALSGMTPDSADIEYQQYIHGEGDDGFFTSFVAASEQLKQIRQKTAVIESLMQSISGVEGKKILIMATRRFGMYAGAEYFQGTVPGKYRALLDTSKYRQSLIRTANAHGITLYPIDPAGLQWTPLDASVAAPIASDLARAGFDNLVLANETMALQEVAAETGGLMAWGSKDIAAVLPRIGDDLDAYYSLGYRAQSTGKDTTREIVVKAKNPAYVVRSRRQFVEKSDQTRMSDRVMAQLFQPVQGSTVAFDVHFGKLKRLGHNRWSVPLEIRIPISGLTVLSRGKDEGGAFSVFVVTGGTLGVMSDVETRTQPFAIPTAQLAQAKKSHFNYEFTLTVDANADRVAVGVFDETGKEYGLRTFRIPKQ